jgi:peptide chain release factor 3
MTYQHETSRRRTFAIISHPDAGKTTLTEKLLLFSGAIHIAGSVKARKASRHATSDWMEIEKQRGISVASSVMQMLYRDTVINLLDTPGHKDFSEDTYRVLTAVDSALMVIDAANGIEPQTERLIAVCRERNTPIITFVNKMDREGREPLELLDEIEQALGMPCVPMTWPVGQGKGFCGIVDLRKQHMRLFKGGQAKVSATEDELVPLTDSLVLEKRFGYDYQIAKDNIELLTIAAPEYNKQASIILVFKKFSMPWSIWPPNRIPVNPSIKKATPPRFNPTAKVFPEWCLKYKRIWTPRTEIALRSSECVRANTNRE